MSHLKNQITLSFENVSVSAADRMAHHTLHHSISGNVLLSLQAKINCASAFQFSETTLTPLGDEGGVVSPRLSVHPEPGGLSSPLSPASEGTVLLVIS